MCEHAKKKKKKEEENSSNSAMQVIALLFSILKKVVLKNKTHASTSFLVKTGCTRLLIEGFPMLHPFPEASLVLRRPCSRVCGYI